MVTDTKGLSFEPLKPCTWSACCRYDLTKPIDDESARDLRMGLRGTGDLRLQSEDIGRRPIRFAEFSARHADFVGKPTRIENPLR